MGRVPRRASSCRDLTGREAMPPPSVEGLAGALCWRVSREAAPVAWEGELEGGREGGRGGGEGGRKENV